MDASAEGDAPVTGRSLILFNIGRATISPEMSRVFSRELRPWWTQRLASYPWKRHTSSHNPPTRRLPGNSVINFRCVSPGWQRHTDQDERERSHRSASSGGDHDGAVILRLRAGKLVCTIGHQIERESSPHNILTSFSKLPCSS